MNTEVLVRKLNSIRDYVDEDPETAGFEIDALIEELEENDTDGS